MRTLTRRLRPHARTAWLTFAAVAVLAVVLAELVVALAGGGRMAVVATAATWFVAVVVLAACLDAVLVPGDPELRQPTPGAGWSGAALGGGHGGGHFGGHGGHGGPFDGGGMTG
ncbi:hypothetical protein [Nocardioides zeicaulis]|uniref:Uncharacterized protein n=1 Tax=Nocardioides zeicaulis TaxID=1776857 RepID=A0ABV6E145_9ACTN